jgi:hypothetical protein
MLIATVFSPSASRGLEKPLMQSSKGHAGCALQDHGGDLRTPLAALLNVPTWAPESLLDSPQLAMVLLWRML